MICVIGGFFNWWVYGHGGRQRSQTAMFRPPNCKPQSQAPAAFLAKAGIVGSSVAALQQRRVA
jgi:hypothetical protein